MNKNFNFKISPKKIEELKTRIKVLDINLDNIEEKHVKGFGKGGQKLNKTNSCVILKYPFYNIVVKCQRERELSKNRFIALREMVDSIEMIIYPESSKRLAEYEKIKKQKDRRKRRSST